MAPARETLRVPLIEIFSDHQPVRNRTSRPWDGAIYHSLSQANFAITEALNILRQLTTLSRNKRRK
jgi:hypothetical protein